MLTFFIYLLTVVLVIDCLFLVLLVLVQLPKKEAGMGQAFGGAATDALFGAGSGNVLTKVTKWCAGIFFGLAIALTIMGTYKTTSTGGNLQKLMQETKSAVPAAPSVPPAPDAAVPNANNPNAALANPAASNAAALATSAATPLKLILSPTNAPNVPAPAPK
jgi:preprotein translocase subunit SecG